MPLPPGFGIFPVNAGVAARRVVAPYGRQWSAEGGRARRPAPTKQFRSWAMRWPPQPRNRTCPSGTKRGHENAVGAALCGRPSPVVGRFPVHPVGFWNGLVRRAPTRTLCHGWSEPGAAVKWHRPKFCTAPGPSGPEGIIPGTIFCAPELLRKGVGVSPVNGGPGENELEPEGTCFRRRCESPPAILWFLSYRWERNSPRGAKPSAWNETCPKTGGRPQRAAPTASQADHSRTRQREGQAPPLRNGGETFCGGKQEGGFQNYFL